MNNRIFSKNNFLLAVTACLKRCSAALFCDGVVAEKNLNIDASSNFAGVVSDLLHENNLDVRKINGIITASGPGSFTGIRISQSFAKGMAFSLKIPAVSVDYFGVIDSIYQQKYQGGDFSRLIVIESDKNQLYFRYYDGKRIVHGVDSHENIQSYIEKNNIQIIIGDASEKLEKNLSVRIDDFRNARHLLTFSRLLSAESQIIPLYINASGSSTIQQALT
ncbi:MAG: tRNA (adenosine(37)-N6)-threonylcarbamoyltransferase complex dimerization subunit type 1 TsaB [Holosporaceae bacterium]|jgi:tRNA threonylcarbamoyl adenosine modification protein YeaZ|nr:tRNA (adenosine(37)-N6)-threonylcarbamoyltransferase complex dimerization subunit type 1 TsaB [Holosporaceae bacterium]